MMLISFSISFVARSVPQASPLYTVWWMLRPNLYLRDALRLLFLYRTALAPIFSSRPDPSVKIFRSGLLVAASLMAFFLFLVIYVVCAGFHPGWYWLGLIFSILFGVRSDLCIRSCNGVRCCLTSHEAALATGLERGCWGGSDVSHRAALCQVLSTKRLKGSKLAIVLTASMGAELSAPVTNRATCLCIAAILLVKAWVYLLNLFLLPTCVWGVKKISTA